MQTHVLKVTLRNGLDWHTRETVTSTIDRMEFRWLDTPVM